MNKYVNHKVEKSNFGFRLIKILIIFGVTVFTLAITPTSHVNLNSVIPQEAIASGKEQIKFEPIVITNLSPIPTEEQDIVTRHNAKSKHRIGTMAKWIYVKTSKVPQRLANEYAEYIVNTIELTLQSLACSHLIVESTGDPFAVSRKGAIGALQIIPKVWEKELKEVGIIQNSRDLYDFRISIDSYKYILTKYKNESRGNYEKALSKYFGDPSGQLARKTLNLQKEFKRYMNANGAQEEG